MRGLSTLGWMVLLAGSATGQDYQATTNANAVIRHAPGPDYGQLGTVPAGTALPVEICFKRGQFCQVRWSDQRGFISGDLLTIDSGETVLAVETERWAAIDIAVATPRLPDYEARNIVAWGDSLSNNTWGDELAILLPGRLVQMEGVGGEDGSRIASRRLSTDRFDRRITVIWDRHFTGEAAGQYVADLAPIFDAQKHERYVVISDIRSFSMDDVEHDRRITGAINAELRARHPDNFLDVTDLLEDPTTRVDGLHLTQKGDGLVARAVADFIASKGW